MRKIFAILLGLLVIQAHSDTPAFQTGQVLTANQLNNAFSGVLSKSALKQPDIATQIATASGTLQSDLNARPTLATLISESGSANLGFKQLGSAKIDTVANKLNRRIDLDDYKLPTDTDDCNALRTAITENPSAVIYLPPRTLEMGSSSTACNITISKAVTLKGTGWSDGGNTGTVLHIPNKNGSLFTLNSPNARGTTFEGFSLKQDQPTPASGWTPTAYPAVFNIQNTYGGVKIRDVFAVPVYDFIYVRNSGRLDVEMKGQVLHRFIDADQQYDADHYKAHLWPYWSSDNNVLKWQQVNMDGLYLGRVDTPVIDIFCFACYAGAYLVDTPSGSTTKLDGAIRADGSAYGVVVAANNVTADLTLLSTQNEVQPQGTGTPVTGGRAIKFIGNGSIVNVNTLRSDRNDTAVIEFGTSTTGNIVNTNNLYATYANQNNNGSDLVVNNGTGNTVNVAQTPIIANSNGAGCGSSCVVSLGQNYVANQANSLRGLGSVAGNSPTFASIGTDSNIDINLNPKGTGAVAITGTNPTLKTSQSWLNIYGGAGGVGLGSNGTSGVLLNSTQMWPAAGGAYPLGLKTNPWGNVFSNTYSFGSMFASAGMPTISSGFGTSPSVTAANGTVAFRVNVGTGGTASSGVIGLPSATTGWNCYAQDVTSVANAWQTKQTANTATSVTLTNYNNGAAQAWAANDVLAVSCFAY